MDLALPPLFALLIIVASLSSHVGCMCDSIRTVFLALTSFFFRVLMLRSQASPTQAELRVEYSHMANEAIRMTAVELPPKETLGGAIPSISTDAQAQA